MVDEEWRVVEEAVEDALIETHHLANISGLREAKLARHRLVEAQSASDLHTTRDRLEDASEYLELARLARRDCADGFREARDSVARAEAALHFERPVPMTGSPESLVGPTPRRRRSLEDLRRESAADSFEQLRYDVALEEAFAELRRQARGADGNSGATDHGTPADLGAEEALRLASLEVDIERALLRSPATPAESEFRFVSTDQLSSRDGARAEES